MYNHILSIILFTPLVGAVLLMLVPKENKDAIRWIGNIFGFLGFAVSLPLIPWFWALKDRAGFQFVEGAPNNWIPSIGSGYVIGIDGISDVYKRQALYSREGMVLDQAALERGPEPEKYAK